MSALKVHKDRKRNATTFKVQRMESSKSHEQLLNCSSKAVLSFGQSINPESVLHAAMHDDIHALDFLLKRGGDVHWANHEKMTALHFARSEGTTQRLLEGRADVEAKTNAARVIILVPPSRIPGLRVAILGR